MIQPVPVVTGGGSVGGADIIPTTDNTYKLGDPTHRWTNTYTLNVNSAASALTFSSSLANGATPAMTWDTPGSTFLNNNVYQWKHNGAHLFSIYPSGNVTYFGFDAAVTKYFSYNGNSATMDIGGPNSLRLLSGTSLTSLQSVLGETQTAGAIFQNISTATAGALNQQYSPGIQLTGSQWNGVSADTVDWMIQHVTNDASTWDAGDLVFWARNSGGTYPNTWRTIAKIFNAGHAGGAPSAKFGLTNSYIYFGDNLGWYGGWGAGGHFWSAQSYITGLTEMVGGNPIVHTDSTAKYPATDNVFTLGKAANRWSNVYTLGVNSASSSLSFTTTAGAFSFTGPANNTQINFTDGTTLAQFFVGVGTAQFGTVTVGAPVTIVSGNASRVYVDSTGAWPASDNTYISGSATHRWSNVYGTIFTNPLTGIGTAQTIGATHQNSTTAALGAQQYSPAVEFQGNGFDSNLNSSKAFKMALQVRPVQQAADPLGDLVLYRSSNGAAYSEMLAFQWNGSYPQIYNASSLAIYGGGVNGMYADNTGAYFLQGGASRVFVNSNGISPYADATYNNGAVAGHWYATFSMNYYTKQQTYSGGGAYTINPQLGESIIISLGAAAITTITVTACSSYNQTLRIIVKQDATGGRTCPTSWTNVVFANNGYTVSTAANAVDVIELTWDNTASKWQETDRALNVGITGTMLTTNYAANGATARSFNFNNTTAFTTAGSALMGWQSAGTEVASIMLRDQVMGGNGWGLDVAGPGHITTHATDGATAVGLTVRTYNAFSTTGSKLISFLNSSTEKLYLTKEAYVVSGGTAPTPSVDTVQLGTGATSSVTGTAQYGKWAITTGSAVAITANTTFATLTLPHAFPANALLHIFPIDANAGTLFKGFGATNGYWYCLQNSTNQVVIRSTTAGTNGLSTATTYTIGYRIEIW